MRSEWLGGSSQCTFMPDLCAEGYSTLNNLPLVLYHLLGCVLPMYSVSLKSDEHMHLSIYYLRIFVPRAYFCPSSAFVIMVRGGLKPGCLAARLLIGLGQPHLSP